jgi:hypothetical protein
MTAASDNKFPKVIITEGSAPSSPSAGDQKVYIDSSSHHLSRKNSSGTVVDLETNQTGGFATTAHAECTADVTLSSINTLTDSTGASVSLAAGTWDIVGNIVFQSNATGGYCYAEIREGTNHMAGARGFLTTGQYFTLHLMARVTPGSTLTYKLSGQTGDASDKIVRYANGTVIGTQITATKVA